MPQENVQVGVAGWSYDDWRGIVYPTHRPSGFHEAEYLSRYVSMIEINTSFYRPLRPEIARVWAKRLSSAEGFRFTAKLYRGFTHEGRTDRDLARQFGEGLEPLIDAGLLGCVLMQFPFSFRYTSENLRHLQAVARLFGQYPLVAEMRHASWNCREALRALADVQIGFCNVDQPQISQCMPPTAHLTSSIGYVRFHGRNYEEWFNFEQSRSGLEPVQARYDFLYNEDQLDPWKQRIAKIADRAETVYVVTNNHFQGKAVVNALQILSSIRGERVEAPETLIERYPELNSTVSNLPAQRSLFFEAGNRRPRPARVIPIRQAPMAAVYARA